MRTYAFVFARGGSKGLPNKNIKLLGGKSLVEHSLELAKSVPKIDDIFVSTDSSAIADIALNLNCHVIERPAVLSADDSPEWAAWQHAIEKARGLSGEFDVFLSLPATSPLRNVLDVENCLNALCPDVDVVVSMKPSYRSPWFNMVQEHDGLVKLVNKGSFYRRQDTPVTYDMTTVAFATRPTFIENNKSIWDGRVAGFCVPEERAIDIDSAYDFEIAEFLYKKLISTHLKK